MRREQAVHFCGRKVQDNDVPAVSGTEERCSQCAKKGKEVFYIKRSATSTMYYQQTRYDQGIPTFGYKAPGTWAVHNLNDALVKQRKILLLGVDTVIVKEEPLKCDYRRVECT